MNPYYPLVDGSKAISTGFFQKSIPGAEPLKIPAQKDESLSSAGCDVYVDRENRCVITRTGNSVYVSQHSAADAFESSLAALRRFRRANMDDCP
ncbi:hypothetical protein [Acidithiobacillus ferridurans]|uniref:Uncharacterized protein n=1 Tax=Acidithiobacillus ferridurans TaxID=1232575 RepID=A0A8X8KB58_ACIFI|nr:hypothetical protein [Acidithiobacillus ferridurans]MBU2715607.1 hypothetical protein [Acidithiobacillus ferridurans]MBU2722903.1 hypothetical protein [Acidithiobacillus ferridurans]MBU2728205.1 hypothetical protein [Acidithiobacillus ferridurans]